MGMCMMKVVATSIRSLFQQVLFSSEFTIIRDEHACEKMDGADIWLVLSNHAR